MRVIVDYQTSGPADWLPDGHAFGLGPMRAGPFGILQTVADGLKLFLKESVVPRRVELGVYLAAPVMAMVPAFLKWSTALAQSPRWR